MELLMRAFEIFADNPAAPQRETVGDPFGGLLGLVAPLIRDARAQLGIELEQLKNDAAHYPYDPAELAPLLLSHLATQLSHLTLRTAVLEMHAARERGELVGATPEARFNDYVRRLHSPEYAFEILARYGVLARQVVIACEQWVTASRELAARLVADWPRIERHFFAGAALGRVIEIQGGAGDLHRRGRSVLVLRFATGQRLVYKPRSLAVERHFQDFVRWTNARGLRVKLRPINLLDESEYGWMECLEHDDCPDEAAIKRFYRRQGSFLALVYLLSATDLHSENLIAHGEHPALIDLEALFHHRLPGPRKDAASLGLTDSVLAVRMLPQLTYVEGFEQPIDFSGLGGASGQATPFQTRQWQNLGRDDMRLVSRPAETPPSQHRPRIAGREADYREHLDDFIDGFADAYRLLARHRDELAAADGPIAAFADDEVRFIPRPTQVYAILLEQSFHPQRLAGDDERQRLFARLGSQAANFACLERLLPYEQADLNRNDIPLFATRAASRDLFTSLGARIENFFPEPALRLVERRIADLGDDDLERQLWLIRTSFALAGRGAHRHVASGTRRQCARQIGERLLALSHRAGEDIGWIGLHPRGRGWSIGAVGSDVARGQAGIAIYLAHLAKVVRAPESAARFAAAARQAAAAIVDRLSWDTDHRHAVGGLPSAGLVPQALAHLSQLWRDADLASDAVRVSNRLGVELSSWDFDGSFARAGELIDEALRTTADVPAPPCGAEQPGLDRGLAGVGLRLLAM